MPPKHKNTGVPDPRVVHEELIVPSTLEKIDEAFFEHIDKVFNIHATTNKGFKKVPTLWMTAERSFQIKNDQNLRDKNGSLILPIMTIERISIEKNPIKKGVFYGNVPPVNDEKGGSIIVARKIKQDKTSNFKRADTYRLFGQLNYPFKNDKIVYQTVTIPMPVPLLINYAITLKTEYQQQMNDLLTPFVVRPGNINHFVIKKDKHLYEAFVQPAFAQTNNMSTLGEDEKTYQTTVNIEVLGYLIGSGDNQDQPKLVVRENAVVVKIPRERVINKDEPEHDDDSFYRR